MNEIELKSQGTCASHDSHNNVNVYNLICYVCYAYQGSFKVKTEGLLCKVVSPSLQVVPNP
jgi:hypothetical protein